MTNKEQDKEQSGFDELTIAIFDHNAAVAETIVQAQKSLLSAKSQLKQAEDFLEMLKKYIIEIVNK